MENVSFLNLKFQNILSKCLSDVDDNLASIIRRSVYSRISKEPLFGKLSETKLLLKFRKILFQEKRCLMARLGYEFNTISFFGEEQLLVHYEIEKRWGITFSNTSSYVQKIVKVESDDEIDDESDLQFPLEL